jgi:hypothetical protein
MWPEVDENSPQENFKKSNGRLDAGVSSSVDFYVLWIKNTIRFEAITGCGLT